jgi:tRNA(Arg) A34 adenosine deaminase TadA
VAQYCGVAKREGGGKQREDHDCETIDTAPSFQVLPSAPRLGLLVLRAPDSIELRAHILAMHPTEIRITNPDWVASMVDYSSRYTDDDARVRLTIQLARENVLRGTGGPFGAAVFDETGRLVGVGTNGVMRLKNSSAHAEIVALAMAQAAIGSFTLQNDGQPRHELFSSCEPCAMCLGATLWSGVTRVVFAATREDATRSGFDEGPVFADSYRYLENRGVTIERGRLRNEGAAVLELYVERGGPIYNP